MLFETLSAIERLAELEPDWDSYGADAPSADVRNRATDFVRQVAAAIGNEYAPPVVGPSASGGVVLIWRHKAHPVKLEVFVSPSGSLRYLVLQHEKLIDSGSVDEPAEFAFRVVKPNVVP